MKDKEELEVSFGQNEKAVKLSLRKGIETRVEQLEKVVHAQIEIIRALQN